MISAPDTMRAILAANNVVLGPMAGIAEAPFRGICKRFGAGLTCTEMVSAKGLHYNPDAPASAELLAFDPAEVPCAVQIFGSEPELMAEAAALIVARKGADVAAIDINMGCPVTKVVARGEGSALMRTPELAAAIVRAVAGAVDVPITVKFRKGWDATDDGVVDFALAMEAAGAAALTVHGRTRGQYYAGKADWDSIAAVARAASVPVIGSGDVVSPEDAARMLEHTGVDAVMIARGAQGRPWIFAQARALIDRGEVLAPPAPVERVEIAREHTRRLVAFAGEHAFTRMRKHVAWYVKGLPEATALRQLVFGIESYAALDALLLEYEAFLRRWDLGDVGHFAPGQGEGGAS